MTPHPKRKTAMGLGLVATNERLILKTLNRQGVKEQRFSIPWIKKDRVNGKDLLIAVDFAEYWAVTMVNNKPVTTGQISLSLTTKKEMSTTGGTRLMIRTTIGHSPHLHRTILELKLNRNVLKP
jgi:hypothetical protein